MQQIIRGHHRRLSQVGPHSPDDDGDGHNVLTMKLQKYERELELHREELCLMQLERDKALRLVQAAEEREAVREKCENVRVRDVTLMIEEKKALKDLRDKALELAQKRHDELQEQSLLLSPHTIQNLKTERDKALSLAEERDEALSKATLDADFYISELQFENGT